MKKLLTFLIPLFLFISCEDEAQDATACADTLANMEANMEAATTKFENEPTRLIVMRLLSYIRKYMTACQPGLKKMK